MKKHILLVTVVVITVVLILPGCAPEREVSQPEENGSDKEIVEEVDEIEPEEPGKKGLDGKEEIAQEKRGGRKVEEEIYYSPFTGKPVAERKLQKAVMVSIENSPPAQPQAGLAEASIIYEYLVEGGITRFLALYWSEIPDKIGPIRSVRPYLITTALEYNPLLLHAGASPGGFTMLEEVEITNLDQIYNGRFYWRDGKRKRPHNLYTGFFKFSDYLNKLTGQVYEKRFNFQQINLIRNNGSSAREITIDLWGRYNIFYRYRRGENIYVRYHYDWDHPHLNEKSEPLTAKNIIVQFVDTRIKDEVGRLTMELRGRGRALIFCGGKVVEGYWEKNNNDRTNFYTEEGTMVTLNPGRTWIEIVPETTEVNYQRSDNDE